MTIGQKAYGDPAPELAMAQAVTFGPLATHRARIEIIQAATPATTAALWSIVADAGFRLELGAVRLVQGFRGTLVAVESRYAFRRFTLGPPTGGAALPVQGLASDAGADGVADARFAEAGLTLGTTVLEAEPLAALSLPLASIIGIPVNLVVNAPKLVHDFNLGVTLLEGEGLALTAWGAAALAGASLVGWVDLRATPA